jgi:stalled ribosome rescue protein Dom34
MKTIAGVWIDHRQAVMTTISDRGEESKVIESNVEKHAGRIAGIRSTTPYEAQKVQADDRRQREFTGHLQGYYDEVIAALGDAEAILIFGPGEAKGELQGRLEEGRLAGRIAAVEPADKMTDRQIAAKVREYFRT